MAWLAAMWNFGGQGHPQAVRRCAAGAQKRSFSAGIKCGFLFWIFCVGFLLVPVVPADP